MEGLILRMALQEWVHDFFVWFVTDLLQLFAAANLFTTGINRVQQFYAFFSTPTTEDVFLFRSSLSLFKSAKSARQSLENQMLGHVQLL